MSSSFLLDMILGCGRLPLVTGRALSIEIDIWAGCSSCHMAWGSSPSRPYVTGARHVEVHAVRSFTGSEGIAGWSDV